MNDDTWYPYRILIPDHDSFEDVYNGLVNGGYDVYAKPSSDKIWYLYILNADDIDGIVRSIEDEDIEYELQEWDMEPE